MELISRQIVEIIKLNDTKYVLCQIIIKPREIYFYRGQNEPYLSHRWMRDTDWAAFDGAIQNLLDCDFKSPQTVPLSASSIDLNVEKVNINDAKHLKNILGNDLQSIKLDMAIKCQIEYLSHKREQPLGVGLKGDSHIEVNKKIVLAVPRKVLKKSPVAQVKAKQSKKKIQSAKIAEPKKKLNGSPNSKNTSGDDAKFQDQFLDFMKSADVSFNSEESKNSIDAENTEQLEEMPTENPKCILNAKTPQRKKVKNYKEYQTLITANKKSKNDSEDVALPEHSNGQDYTTSIEHENNSNKEEMDEHDDKDEHSAQLQNVNENTPEREKDNKKSRKQEIQLQLTQTVRRSARSPTKPQRYIDVLLQGKKRTRELDNTEPNIKRLTKRKDNVIEPHRVKSIKTPDSGNKVIFRSPQPFQQSTKFLNGKRKHFNQKLYYEHEEEFLRELGSPTPSEVPKLTLDDMTIEEIMNTLEPVRSKLNSLFQKLRGTGYIKSHEGINHYLVIGLISNDIQKQMMDRLSELYETEESPKYGSHFINVLMPEWLLSIFMQRYNMNREQAIEQISQQNESYGLKRNDRQEQEQGHGQDT